jgi:hypothetical protein
MGKRKKGQKNNQLSTILTGQWQLKQLLIIAFITRRVSIVYQELLTHTKNLRSPPILVELKIKLYISLSVISDTNKSYLHNLYAILLKVALKTS